VAPRNARGGLRWRPIVPGSDQHIALMARAAPAMQRVLYPSLFEREQHRRASEVIAAAATKQANKAERPGLSSEAFTAPRTRVIGNADGCSSECA
jgi:hypothetical protein